MRNHWRCAMCDWYYIWSHTLERPYIDAGLRIGEHIAEMHPEMLLTSEEMQRYEWLFNRTRRALSAS